MNVVFGMPGDHADPLGVQVGTLGEILAVEEPFGVLVQFVPALAVAVERGEEGAGVAGVDLDRPLEAGADLPDRVELGVVDREEAAVAVADAQAERLVKLEALGAGFEALGQPGRLSVGPARVVDTGKVDEGVGEEPAGVRLVESGQSFLESVAPAAVQVDHRSDAGGIHLREVALDALRRERRLAAAQVVVNVDDRERRLGDLGRLGDQHGPRLPVAELQLLDVILFLRMRRDAQNER